MADFSEDYSEKVRDYYNNLYRYPWDQIEGSTLPRRQRPIQQSYVEQLISDANIKEGDKILDIGCGSVELAVNIAQRVRGVTIECLDISDYIMDYNLKILDGIHGKERTILKRGDFNKLSEYYPAEYFDKIIAIDSFSFAENGEHLINEIRKVLNPYGYVYIRDLFCPIFSPETDLFNQTQLYQKFLNQMSFCNYIDINNFINSFCTNKFLINEVKNLTEETYKEGDAYFLNFVISFEDRYGWKDESLMEEVESTLGFRPETDLFEDELDPIPVSQMKTSRGAEYPFIVDYLGFRFASYDLEHFNTVN